MTLHNDFTELLPHLFVRLVISLESGVEVSGQSLILLYPEFLILLICRLYLNPQYLQMFFKFFEFCFSLYLLLIVLNDILMLVFFVLEFCL